MEALCVLRRFLPVEAVALMQLARYFQVLAMFFVALTTRVLCMSLLAQKFGIWADCAVLLLKQQSQGAHLDNISQGHIQCQHAVV